MFASINIGIRLFTVWNYKVKIYLNNQLIPDLGLRAGIWVFTAEGLVKSLVYSVRPEPTKEMGLAWFTSIRPNQNSQPYNLSV